MADTPASQTTLDEAAAMLRAAGWLVLPPTPDKLPEPEVGQTWVSPKSRVEPRTVIKLGPGRGRDTPCVFFTTPSRLPDPKWGPTYLSREAWDAWVKKSEARPA